MSTTPDLDGPSLSDLAAIEAEWPRIEDDLTALDAKIQALYAADRGGPSELDRRRVRRAAARATRTATTVAHPAVGRHVCDPWRRTEIGMADCSYGCKVMRCDDCGGEHVEHRAVYGCPVGHLALRPAA